MPKKSADEPPPWKDGEAKELLRKDIVNGKIDGKGPKEVYNMRPEYRAYKYDNFVTNLRNLRKSLAELQERADDDAAALAHDEALDLRSNGKPYPRWQGTEAETLLKLDIDNDQQKNKTPRELQATRPEYAPYPSKVFRDHIHQETRSRLERSYWLARRKEKEEAEKRKRRKQADTK